MTPDRAIETAADYADALMTSRRAKHLLVLVVLLVLLAQMLLFFLVRYDVIHTSPPTEAATQPVFDWSTVVHYLVGFTVFLGLGLTIVLSFVLLLIVNIMLVGRLIGVGRLTSAYIWCLVLLVLVFPWQVFLSNVGLTWEAVSFKFPGVLYTWPELIHPREGAKFSNEPLTFAILKWARFVGLPLVAVIILLSVQVKSSRGLRQALGEEMPTTSDHDTTPTV